VLDPIVIPPPAAQCDLIRSRRAQHAAALKFRDAYVDNIKAGVHNPRPSDVARKVSVVAVRQWRSPRRGAD
jgi:hypothetical protein